jgi:hypothetical protein
LPHVGRLNGADLVAVLLVRYVKHHVTVNFRLTKTVQGNEETDRNRPVTEVRIRPSKVPNANMDDPSADRRVSITRNPKLWESVVVVDKLSYKTVCLARTIILP